MQKKKKKKKKVLQTNTKFLRGMQSYQNIIFPPISFFNIIMSL